MGQVIRRVCSNNEMVHHVCTQPNQQSPASWFPAMECGKFNFSLETGNTVLLKKCLLFKLLLLIIYYFICPCSAHFIYIPAESLCNPPGDDFLGVDCVTPVNERFPIFGRFSHQSSITCVCKQGFEGIANKLLIN